MRSATMLRPCPGSPNCVSSDATEGAARVDPLPLVGEPESGWKAARAAVLALPRTKIVDEHDGYIHAECTSALFGFVDDLELHTRVADGVIAVRSASRVGYSDLGANRARVETLRSTLKSRGVNGRQGDER